MPEGTWTTVLTPGTAFAFSGPCSSGPARWPVHLAAEDRSSRHDRGQHPGQLHVHSELRSAGHLFGRVQAPGRFAEDLPVLGVLESNLGWRLKLLRGGGELAKREPVAVPHDEAVFRAAGGGIDLPLLRGGLDQHLARHRAGLPVAVEFRPGRGRTAGHLHSVGCVRVDGRGRRVLDADLRPVAAELFGDQHRQSRPDALAHLRVGKQNRDALVRADAQERVRIGKRLGRRRRSLEGRESHSRGHGEADHETGRGLEESAPVETGRAHAFLRVRSAAR